MAEPQMDAEVAKRLAEAETKRVELEKRLADAETKATKAEADAKDNAEKVAKMLEASARTEAYAVAKSLDKVPGKTDDLGTLLFVAKRSLESKDFDALVTVLKAAHDQIAKGALFSVRGSDGESEGGSELDKLVHKRMSEKSEPQHIALANVLKTDEGKAAYSANRGN